MASRHLDTQLVVDHRERQEIASNLTKTFIVEAGAGSGKTTALVERVTSLVLADVSIANIVAITFTEKAGNELRTRLRNKLMKVLSSNASEDIAKRQAVNNALRDLDGAAIGTIHSFAQRLLTQYPIEARVPLRITVYDNFEATLAFEKRWTTFLNELHTKPEICQALGMLLPLGFRVEQLKEVAEVLEDNWDRLSKVTVTNHDFEANLRNWINIFGSKVQNAFALWIDKDKSKKSTRSKTKATSKNEDDTVVDKTHSDSLKEKLRLLAEKVQELSEISNADLLAASMLQLSNEFSWYTDIQRDGLQANWHDVQASRRVVSGLYSELKDQVNRVVDAVLQPVLAELVEFVLNGAEERRTEGTLRFHDLLVFARELLSSSESVVEDCRERYQYLLVDEFQDTDPVQLDIVRALSVEGNGTSSGRKAGSLALDAVPGRLFLVGDPKQSIYRFRRAEVRLFSEILLAVEQQSSDACAVLDSQLVRLTTNFRTIEPIVHWVNDVFRKLMQPLDGHLDSSRGDVPYVPLAPVRQTSERYKGLPVAILGGERDAKADELRAEEASKVALAIRHMVSEKWTVALEEPGDEGWREVGYKDIGILTPSRASLPFLEEALENCNIPFRSESALNIYSDQSVRDLLMVMRAIDDPANALHVVAALRTPLFGCSDEDLHSYHVRFPMTWDYREISNWSEVCEQPVGKALFWLSEQYQKRYWLSPTEMLDLIVRERRVLEIAMNGWRFRDIWRRIRFVLDQARAWQEVTNGNLRDYVRWVSGQMKQNLRVEETIIPEADDDVVRVMTMHAAKGLEFPVVLLAGMSGWTSGAASSPPVLFEDMAESPLADGSKKPFADSGPAGFACDLGKFIRSASYDSMRKLDSELDEAELNRLLYVACTRARDHLVVSLYRRKAGQSYARVLAEHNSEKEAEEFAGSESSADEDAGSAVGGLAMDVEGEAEGVAVGFKEWQEKAGAARSLSFPSAVSATSVGGQQGHGGDAGGLPEEVTASFTTGESADAADAPVPARDGTKLGTVVHAVMEALDLAKVGHAMSGHGGEAGGGADVASLVERFAAEADLDAGDLQMASVMVRHALGSRSVLEAGRSRHWREVYVCTPVGERVLEGYVDLLYETDQGLVVVDYKTSNSSDPANLKRRVEGYGSQGASYALALSAATGKAIARVTFLFLTRKGAVEIDMDNLDQEIEKVKRYFSLGVDPPKR